MLRIKLRHKPRKMPKADLAVARGPEGRISKMRKLVTALIRHERIEGRTQHIEESRGYAERLIQMAISRGDKDPEMMEIANYWLLEKDLIHKLFKVLVPRYEDHKSSYTAYHKLPFPYPRDMNRGGEALLELKKNPYPPLCITPRDVSGSLLNVLLDEAKKDHRKERLAAATAKKEKEFMEKRAAKMAMETDVDTGVAMGTEGGDGVAMGAEGGEGVGAERSEEGTDVDAVHRLNNKDSDASTEKKV